MSENKRYVDVLEHLIATKRVRNQQQFTEEIESDKATVSQIKNGKIKIPNNMFANIEKAYGNISAEWIKTGIGKMLKNKPSVSESNQTDIPLPNNDDSLPLIPFECMAGFGEDNSGINLNECERYNIPEFKNIGAEFLVRVGGSSMYPKYSSGDILACKKIHERLFYQWGKVYVIDSSQGQLIKRVFEHENPDMILLVSDNKEKYQPFPIPKSDIRSLSIVLGVVRME